MRCKSFWFYELVIKRLVWCFYRDSEGGECFVLFLVGQQHQQVTDKLL